MKKKVLMLVVTFAIASALCGRFGESEETQVNGTLECIAGNGICSEWKDTETGVHYFYTHKGGLEVRLNVDGTPYAD